MVKKAAPVNPARVRTQILQAADTIINKDRAKTYGGPEDSFGKIAAYWSVYLTIEVGQQIQVTPSDVAKMMSLLKVARIHGNPTHVDSHIDLVGYAALAAEMDLSSLEGNLNEIGK